MQTERDSALIVAQELGYRRTRWAIRTVRNREIPFWRYAYLMAECEQIVDRVLLSDFYARFERK